MPAKKVPPAADLNRAAELRAAGMKWESVAAELNRSVEAVRSWPAAFPAEWQAALRDAERRLVSEAGSEAVLVLRSLLRSEDEKVRRDAARSLIDLRIELARVEAKSAETDAPPLSSEARNLVAFLEGHTDEQLARLAAGLHGPAVPQPESGGVAAVDGPA